VRRTFASNANETINASAKAIGRSGKSSKRRRLLLLTGGGLAIGAAAVTINDDAKHAYVAAQRSYRVVATLVLNISEYVGGCGGLGRHVANISLCTATAMSSSATMNKTTPNS
jgi:hypothetical protein